MTPKPEDLKGVTVGGEPLAAVLARESEKRKAEEAEDIANGEVREKRRIIIRHHGAGPMPAETSRVSRRARHLTPDEIRKEYGIMKAPYATKIENILWVVKNNGPITSVGVSKVLDEKIIRVQGVLSLLSRTLEPAGYLKRELVSGAYEYQIPSGLTVEECAEKHRAAKVWKKRAKVRRPAFVYTPPSLAPDPDSTSMKAGETTVKQPADLDPRKEVPTDRRLVAAIERVIEKELGVRVEVTGRIEFVFRLGS